MRVLVTGGAGFIGSHLVDRLVSSGHNVTVVDNLSTGSATNLKRGAAFVRHDIRDPLIDVFAAARPEVVVHLAAQVSVPNSVRDPATDQAVNVAGVVNVMESAAQAGAKKVVAISSAAVYGVPGVLPVVETAPLHAVSPYGLSKLTGEAYVRLLAELRGLRYTIIRPANVYGPRQTTEGEGAVIPAFLQRFLQGHDPVIHGDGTQTRDFVYVEDMTHALVFALTRADGHIVNVSSGVGVSVRELWLLLAQMTGWTRPPVYGPPRAGDILHSAMENSEARRYLDWAPRVPLPAGLADTVQWHIMARVAATRE